MDKSKIYLDLSKCTEGEIKETYKKIKNSNQNIHTQTKRDLINGIVTHCYWFLFFDGNAWNQNGTPLSGRTELTYREFIKLFEGGEVENIDYKSEFEKLKSLVMSDSVFWCLRRGIKYPSDFDFDDEGYIELNKWIKANSNQ